MARGGLYWYDGAHVRRFQSRLRVYNIYGYTAFHYTCVIERYSNGKTCLPKRKMVSILTSCDVDHVLKWTRPEAEEVRQHRAHADEFIHEVLPRTFSPL